MEYKLLLSQYKLKKKNIKVLHVQQVISRMCWKCSAWKFSYLELGVEEKAERTSHSKFHTHEI